MSSTGLTADKKQSSRAGQLIKNAGAAVIIVAGFKIALPLLGKAGNSVIANSVVSALYSDTC